MSDPAPSPASPEPSDPAASTPARRQVTRRDLLATGGRAAAVGGALWLLEPVDPALAAPAPADNGATGSLTVSEGTNISASAAPGGAQIAMDLYTVIWLVPADGGRARPVTGPLGDASRPHMSPDGKRLAFQSYREGTYHIYVVDLPDGEPRRITSGPHDHREPRFSPDGSRIAMSSDRGGNYGIWIHDLDSGELSPLAGTDGASDEAEPSWTPDGKRIVHTTDGTSVRSTGTDGDSRVLVKAREHTEVYSPALSPDGATLAYVRAHGETIDLVVGDNAVTSGEDVFVGAVSWSDDHRVLYTADGHIRHHDTRSGASTDTAFSATVRYRRVEHRPAVRDLDSGDDRPVQGIASPVASPDGRRVAFRALGALWVLDIGGKARRIVEAGSFSSDPDWHPDGTSLVYSSDREGTPALWRHDLDSGSDERLTRLDGAQLTPRWAPDGNRIAYQDQDGATWILDVADGSTRKVLPELFMPGRPTWSADGATLALAAVVPRSQRFREGTSQILTVDLDSGTTRYTEPAPYRSLSTRGDDGPVWSPDGRHMAFVMESVLWVVAVNGRGEFTGEPRQVTSEVTDAPSWLDTDTLLYLNNGRLRRVPASGGEPKTVAHGLTWKPARPEGRTVIRAGALWDGTATQLRTDVDIVLDGNRITEVRDRSGASGDEDGTEVVDATDLTVMPGLIDAHNHWHLRGRAWGARQGRLWLAYGITTTRSPGDPAYQMVETREALTSGAVVGPRYFATGEAVDGTRIYYNFMRPTLDRKQLDLELDRALALGYDMVKTYVRLPVDLQKAAVRAAHAEGVPLSSHYLYPAALIGMDGMEHTGATNRLGYSHTTSYLGRSYADTTKLFVKSGMSITPTLFTSVMLYADDRSLIEDERTRTLFPAWEYEALLANAELAGSDTPTARRYREMLSGKTAMLRAIHEGGGTVIGGTDAPLDHIAISLHQNMRALVRDGFTPHQALTTSISTSAAWLGLGDQLGTVEPGRLADLAIVDGDPLSDISAAARVRMVVSNGEVHTVEDLLKPFAGSSGGEQAAPQSAESEQPEESDTTKPAPTRRLEQLASADPDRHWWHGEGERTSPHRC